MSIPIRKRIAAGTSIGMPTFFLCCVFVLASYASEKGHPNIYVEPFETFVNETIQVKAREYVHYTLQLNKGTTLHAKFIVSGGSNNKADVWLLDSSNYQLFRNNQQFMYYDGTSVSVRGVAGYSFTIPKTDNYELIIDNTKATKYSRTVSLYVYGIFPQATARSGEIAQAFQQIYEEEALSKLYIDDRHTISPQRARNIVNWISQQDELLRRWQKMLIPNMQSDALRELDKETDPWINHELIRSELKRRQLIP